jgi:hypothetical protein
MADQVRAPVAIRVMRPYSSEDAFLEHELETLTRTSIVLVGAQSRPQGVVLRFEVVLENGTSVLRGEGRVVGHKANAFGESAGLTLRFTRLDTRSKALIDRAAMMRDEKTRAALGSAAPASPSKPPAPIHPAQNKIPVDLTPPPAPTAIAKVATPPVLAQTREAPAARISQLVADTGPERAPMATAPDVPSPQPSEPILVASTGEIPAVSAARAAELVGGLTDREAVLTRLRERRRGLTDARMTEIFALKRRG